MDLAFESDSKFMNSHGNPPIFADESWPHFGEDEISAATDVLRSGQVDSKTGDRVAALERAFETSIGGDAVALTNGTVALELCLRTLGIGQDDQIILPSRASVSAASTVRRLGATPVFADVDRDSQTVTPITIMPMIGRRTKAIVATHLAGWPCNMQGILALAELNSLLVIEDCSEAVGASISRKPVGSFGHAAAFSFGQDRIVSTGGEGGLALFRDEAAGNRARRYKDHGRDSGRVPQPTENPIFPRPHETIGTNWKLTELQAAIGLSQIAKLEDMLARRRANAKAWFEGLRPSPLLRLPRPEARFEHAYYKVYAFLKPEQMRAGTTRDDVLAALNEAGVRAFVGTCAEVYREPVFDDLKVSPRPVAQELGETSLMFECHPNLNSFRLQQTADRAREIIDGFVAGR